MSRIYTLKSTDATPPAIPRGQTKQYYLKDKRNPNCNIITLEYHVWTEEGIPKDAYTVPGTTRVLSHYQVQRAIESGVLTEVLDETPMANALAA